MRSYLLVFIQFAAILAILLTGPLWAQAPWLLALELAGLALVLWALLAMRLANSPCVAGCTAQRATGATRAVSLASSSHVQRHLAGDAGAGTRHLHLAAPGLLVRLADRSPDQVALRRTLASSALSQLPALPTSEQTVGSLCLLRRPYGDTRSMMVAMPIPPPAHKVISAVA